MSWLRVAVARLRGLFGRTQADRELEEEIALHLELETAKYLREGMSPVEARRQARIAFGAIEATKEEHRDGRGVRWLHEAIADARHACRALARNPVLGVTAILTLAIGIGANTAIYSAVNAVILRPLPFLEPSRLVMLWEDNTEKDWHFNVVAPANYLDWKDESNAFQDIAAYFAYPNTVTLTGSGEPRVFTSYSTTGNFFSVLGVLPEAGRGFTPEESWNTGTRVAVISHRMWQQQFGGAADVVGRSVLLNDRSYQVVGVMPDRFRFPDENVDIWVPTLWDPARRSQPSFRRAHSYRAIGRLKPGESLTEADQRLQGVVHRLQRDYPDLNKYMGAGMTPLQEFLTGDTREALLVLLGAVALLLLIACANVGNLMLVQAAGRGREMAVRLALGARRGRLIRQAFTESLVLSAFGGIAGLVLGWYGTDILFALQPKMLPVEQIGMDWSVLAFVVAITVGSGILFGIAPVLWARQRAPGEVLKEGARGSVRKMWRWGRALVVAEVSLAVLLSLGAGLLVRSFQQLERVHPGFNPEGVLTIALNVPGARYDSADKISGFYQQMIDRIDALPGVVSSALTTTLPLGGGVGWTSDFSVAGRAPDKFGVDVAHRSVSPDYFRTMQVPLVSGRAFTSTDALNGDQVVVINESLARSAFAGEEPVGQRLTFDRIPDSTSRWRTIVGVVGDERQSGLSSATKIEIITPEKQAPSTFMNVMIRTTGDPLSAVPAIRRAVAELDPGIAFTSVQSMNQVRDQSLARARFLMLLLFSFAGTGLLLAVVGVYGVMAHAARNRTREMGIRIALGAPAGAVRWLVIREGMMLTVIGVLIGAAAALVACRAMVVLLYQVGPADPVTFVVVLPLLTATALLATWLPAERASRVNPVESLRTE